MNKKVKFQTSERFNARQFSSAFNNKFEKMLVEIITNSDDNYISIERKNRKEKFFIKILIDANNKKIYALDEGTGMSEEELNEKFVDKKYGDKKK